MSRNVGDKNCSNLPLSPYRALDLTDEKGFLCGRILADFGADVIKIEPPGGDSSRLIGPYYHDLEDGEKSLYWFAYNAEKRGITLDIESPEGQGLFRKLVEVSDFVIESFPPGHLEALGLGFQALRALNPRIILTSVTTFGQTGPYSHYKATDIVAMAMGGTMFVTGSPDHPPLRYCLDQSYVQAGAQAAVGTLIAHHERKRSHEGQHVDVSLQEAMVPATWLPPYYWEYTGVIQTRHGSKLYRQNLVRECVFKCKDGYVSWEIVAGQLGSKTRGMVELMEEEGVAGELSAIDWEALDYTKIPQEQFIAWEELFARWFTTKTKAWLYEKGLQKGTMLMPVNNIEEVLNDAQVKFRNVLIKLEHPELNDDILYPSAPFKTSEPIWETKSRAPLIGEHNEEVYCGLLKITADELNALRQKGVM